MKQDEARALLAGAELIHSAAAVQTALDGVAGRIRAQLADKNPLVLCVMAGGVIFCGQLLPKLDFPLDFDYLHATRYGAETQGGKISWRSAPWISVKDRTVLAAWHGARTLRQTAERVRHRGFLVLDLDAEGRISRLRGYAQARVVGIDSTFKPEPVPAPSQEGT